MVIVGLRKRLTNWFFRRGESLTNWLLRAWGVVDKLVIVGMGESLTK
jgi:hypothetical protein